MALLLFSWLVVLGLGARDKSPAREVIHLDVTDPRHPRHPTYDTSNLTISPDGAFVVYQATADGSAHMVSRRLESLHATRIELPEASLARDPVISPDQEWLAYWINHQLFKVPIQGGEPVFVFNGSGLTKGAAWYDGGIVLSPSPTGGLVRIDADGRGEETLSTPDAARGEVSHRWPDILPDRRHALITIKRSNMLTFDDAEIGLLDLQNGDVDVLLQGGMYARYAPGGYIVFARDGKLLAVRFDQRTLAIVGSPVQVLDNVMTEPGSGVAQFAIARETGSLAYTPGGANFVEKEVCEILADGSTRPLSMPLMNYAGVDVSPDGKRLALTVFGASDAVFVHDLEQGSVSRVTNDGNCAVLCWAPDSQCVLYTSDAGGGRSAYIVDVESGAEPVLVRKEFTAFEVAITPSDDGESLWYIDGGRIITAPLDDESKARTVIDTPFAKLKLNTTPNGRWLTFLSEESGRLETYVRPTTGVGLAAQLPQAQGDSWWSDSRVAFAVDRSIEELEFEVRDDKLVYAGSRVIAELASDIRFVSVHAESGRVYAVRNLPTRHAGDRVHVITNWAATLDDHFPTR